MADRSQPKRDPVTGELVVFHSSLLPPYLHYSVIPSTATSDEQTTPRILAAPVPIPGSRMMHDLGVSSTHSILLDMPLSLDPLNLLVGKPVVCYSPTTPSRFGIFARHFPGDVLWYEAPSCVIFHTALTFDTPDAVNLLCCRMNSSTLVYAAGNIPLPKSEMLSDGQADTCELYYFRFPLDPPPLAAPSHSFPISKVPFEFPCVPAKLSMSESQFVYGCSLTAGSFSAALGSAAKIDALVKINVKRLITRGMAEGRQHDEAVDSRSVAEILAMQDDRLEIGEQEDDIRVFAMPPGWFAQEMSFVPRRQQRGEDDGFLLTYVFDESQLGAQGVPREGATSELWVIDAYNMREVVAKILLPQRGTSSSFPDRCSCIYSAVWTSRDLVHGGADRYPAPGDVSPISSRQLAPRDGCGSRLAGATTEHACARDGLRTGLNCLLVTIRISFALHLHRLRALGGIGCAPSRREARGIAKRNPPMPNSTKCPATLSLDHDRRAKEDCDRDRRGRGRHGHRGPPRVRRLRRRALLPSGRSELTAADCARAQRLHRRTVLDHPRRRGPPLRSGSLAASAAPPL